MYKVTVLLSTYNGEKYLREQLDSILKQDKVNISLLIRDDGSTDLTTTILAEYQVKPNVQVMLSDNIGWKDSFMTLLKLASNNTDSFYAFADQDDIWLPEKLISAIRTIDQSRPMLYHSNVLLMNGSGERLGKRYPESFRPNSKMPYAFLDGFGIGATMVFNQALMSLLKDYIPVKKINHDAFVIALSNLLGTTVYDPDSYILYRRHSGATTGFGNSDDIKKPTLIDRYHRYKKGPKHNFSLRAKYLLVGYGDKLSTADRVFLNRVANYQSSIPVKLYLLFSPNVAATGFRRTMQVKYRVFFNTL